MPKLACRTCGRQIYAVSPPESLAAEERRCPRCGAHLDLDRRRTDRRFHARRVNAPHDPGPPPGTGERRVADRRRTDRRGAADARWATG